MDCPLVINIERAIEWTNHSDWKNEISVQNGTNYYFKNIQFNFMVNISTGANLYYFEECIFTKGLNFETAFRNESQETTNHYEKEVYFYKCKISGQFVAQRSVFDKNFRLHNCCVENLILKNATFNSLADFWLTTFKSKVMFYKTDFNATAVFSMATFEENVLFTYTLLAGKTIFSRTKFSKGLDISQAIISGELKPFDLHFDYESYEAEYVGSDDETYQDYIDKQGIIPLVNKVHTFQILKKAFGDIGNYADSITMNREEKKAFRELVRERLKENKYITGNRFVLWFKRWFNNIRSFGIAPGQELLKENKVVTVNKGDKIILWFNRWSNNYQSDFRNGISFTLIVTLLFGSATLIFTQAFQNNVCFSLNGCVFDEEIFKKGMKFFFNFLNPTRRLTYLDTLKPTLGGIAYIFDFLGRIAVGYGIYQTVQAFRKFK